MSALTSGLVHQSAILPPLVCQRHATFIAKRLGISFGVLAVAPFFLAFRGAPTGGETLVFACSFAPLAAAVVAARTGRLVAAHGVAFLGLIALSLSLWLGLGCGTGCAIAWLVTAQLEATLAGDKRLALWAGVVTGAVLLCILAVSLHGDAALSPAAAVPGAFSGLALAYAVIVGAGGWTRAEAGRQVSPDRTETRIVAPADAKLEETALQDILPDHDIHLWRTASDMLDERVLGFDKTGILVHLPTNCEALFGLSAHDLMGRGLFDRVHVADRPAFLKQIADAAHGDATMASKIRIRTSGTAAPQYRWIEMRTRRISDARVSAQSAVEVAAVLRDIDAIHAQDEELAAAQKSFDEAIRSKDQFLANMSHELRTPLNAIIGFSEMLASRTMRPIEADKQREYARIVHQSGQHLLSVVNAILDMSKIRCGSFALVPDSFDIVALLDRCCDLSAAKADEGRVRILRDYKDGLDEIVGDNRAYKQILTNLLSNAVKFTPEHGQVTVSARPEGDRLVISVVDSGIGIGADDLARIGDPFFQARSTYSRPFEGTGLGLAVVRGLVGLHGGTIEIESELGRGTRVDLTLPLDCRRASPKSTSATIDTIAPRQAADSVLGGPDQRMKKIA